MKASELSIVIPVYNERASAERLVARLERVQSAIDGPTTFILVDDGSNDGTSEILGAIDVDWIRVIRHKENRGYGASLKTGIRSAASDWVAITDADETYPDDRIPDLFELAKSQGLDMLVGARTGPAVQIPWLRRAPKWTLNKIANWLSGREIPDMNSGLRVMRKEAVERFLPILPEGFSFTTTITLAMMSSGYRVEHEPIDYYHRTGRSKIRPIYDTLNFLQLICRTVLWFNPLRVFIPLSLLFILASVSTHLLGRFFLGQPLDVMSGVLMMTGVMVMAVGMLADLIDKRMK